VSGAGGGRGSGDPPHLPVYLIHYQAPDWCAMAVSSILRSEGVRAQVTVVDNGGGERLAKLLPSEVRILTTGPNRGYAGGANAAIGDWRRRFPGEEFLVIASHDLHVERAALRRLVDAATASRSFGVLAPRVSGREHRVPDSLGAGVVEVEWASGTCLLLRRSCLDVVGGFDEMFGSYIEDVELCLRAHDFGWRIGIVSESIARGLGTAHPVQRDRLLATNRVLLAYRRNGRAAALRAVVELGGQTARHGLGTVVPGRTPEGRSRSAVMLRIRLGSMSDALRHLARGDWERRGSPPGRADTGCTPPAPRRPRSAGDPTG
jgi:N-acetylglucosaminyl-diphospho-decaprenol L-rhamnosyltransferase